jgi:lipoate-protein ligase A
MSDSFRVVETGVREGRFNIALDQAMIELHQAGQIPDTLRFIRFPPTALIGRHQALNQEIDVGHCRRNGIGIVRRITGGGAIYLDEGQLGWGLTFRRGALGVSALGDVAREICETVAIGLRRLGVDARYRPRNDIEVDGRKISGTGGFFDGDTLIYQGTVLVDMDPAAMVAALRVPRAKLEKRQLDSVAQRVVTLRELLGPRTPPLRDIQQALLEAFASRFGIQWRSAELTAAEEELAWRRHREEIGTDGFVAEIDDPAADSDFAVGSHAGPGGTITSYLRLEGPSRRRIGQLLITGDFFVAPPRVVLDLEAALRRVELAELDAAIQRFIAGQALGAITVAPEDFRRSIQAAADRATACQS